MTTYITMKGTDRLTLQQAEALLGLLDSAGATYLTNKTSPTRKGWRKLQEAVDAARAKARAKASAATKREDEPTTIRVGNVTGVRLRGRDQAFTGMQVHRRKANLDCWGWILRHEGGMLKRIPPVCGMDVPRESAEKVAKVWGEELDEEASRGQA